MGEETAAMKGKKPTVLVVDGQGGGMGKALIERFRQAELRINLMAAGTNALATSALLKAGADSGATGENAIVYNAARADVIVGGAGILCANAMMGEISPAMAAAISGSEAVKLLVPLNRCKLQICGVVDQPLPAKLDSAVEELRRILAELKEGD